MSSDEYAALDFAVKAADVLEELAQLATYELTQRQRHIIDQAVQLLTGPGYADWVARYDVWSKRHGYTAWAVWVATGQTIATVTNPPL